MKTEKRYTRKFRVVIDGNETFVHVENETQAIERAVEKIYGNGCFWFANSGLKGYGQVFRSLRPTKNNSQPGNTSVTYRVRIDVDTVGDCSRNFLRQYQQDQLDDAEAWEGLQENRPVFL